MLEAAGVGPGGLLVDFAPRFPNKLDVGAGLVDAPAEEVD